MVNACADPEFFVREGGGGGKPNAEKTAMIFLCLFLLYGGGGPNANFYRI